MLRQRIPVAPRALINVSRECVGNLIVRALFPFLFYCSFLLYFSPTNSSSLSLPLSFCRPRTVFRSVSLQVFLLPLEVLHSIHTTPLFQLCFPQLPYLSLRKSSHLRFEFSNQFARCNARLTHDSSARCFSHSEKL